MNSSGLFEYRKDSAKIIDKFYFAIIVMQLFATTVYTYYSLL